MRPGHRLILFILLFGAVSGRAWTQGNAHADAAASRSLQITLGRSAVPLYSPWKFTTGDSPIDPATSAPVWAEPGFDDSKWESLDLTPKVNEQSPITGASGYIQGWTTRGHAGYWGYAWYRIRVQVDSAPGVKLAIAGPAQVDDAYEIYDNGAFVGSFGNFTAHDAGIFYSRPLAFQLPSSPSASQSGSTHVIAFRIWMGPQTLAQASDVGGFESLPSLGEADAIAAQHQVAFDELVRAYLWAPIEAVLFGLLGIVALSLTLVDRSDRVYLWIGGLLLIIAVDAFSGTLAVWTLLVNSRYDQFSHEIALFSLQYAGWVMVWRTWFRQRRPTWIPWTLVPLLLVLIGSQAIVQNFFFTVFSAPVAAAAHAVSLSVRLLITGLLFFVVYQGIREQGLEGWLVMPAVLLATAAEFHLELHRLGVATVWFPFGVQITLPVASSLLLVGVLAVLLLRRLVLSIRSQRLMALDVKQAQEVQRVILPEARTSFPNLEIETEYRPARQVGGDFFQLIPHPFDGSLVVVAGDVAGKGLQAGMLVALLVGAIRSTAEATTNPLSILQALNRRLLGRNEAHATCLAMRISPDGKVTLANAGHVTPYLNGKPVDIDGSLPLGVFELAEFSVATFTLDAGDRLVITSDGLAEAANANGELLGFARVQQLVQTSKSASEVADAAQAFGQQDDISIIALTRTAPAAREGENQPVLDPATIG
ncbi:serine/threonine-protein phosphatase [Acidobacteria bacterium AB60]|nr:serine/threonine-protein phosphatase [Acidobacteria bacterium AB60]